MNELMRRRYTTDGNRLQLIQYIQTTGASAGWNLGIRFTPTTKIRIKFVSWTAQMNKKIVNNPSFGSGTNYGTPHGMYKLNGILYVVGLFRNQSKNYDVILGNNYCKSVSPTGHNEPSGTQITNTLANPITIGIDPNYRFLSVDVYDNDTLIANFVPARIDNIGYFYDTLNDILVPNGSDNPSLYSLGSDKTT